MRYLIDFTYVYQHPGINTGIQRVVRNVYHQLAQLDIKAGDKLIPVIIIDGQVLAIDSLSLPQQGITAADIKYNIHRVVEALNRRRQNLSELAFFARFKPAAMLLQLLYLIAVFPLRAAFRLLGHWERIRDKRQQTKALSLGAGDVMVLLDSSWHYDYEPVLRRGKASGMQVLVVIYDLIPLTHPQFFDARLLKQFNRWFDMVSKYSDGFVAISKTIRDQLRVSRAQSRGLPEHAFQYFYLGAELRMPSTELSVRRDLLINTTARMYLAVGTLEPRKNHRYLLDAFDLLWQQQEDVYFCIVGKVGWKCEDLLKRIKDHPQYGMRLQFISDANDAELVACYKAAKAVLFASQVEGFGLPLVEAWQQGTPVYASDIPVFREIGGEHTQYFDLQDPASLAYIIAGDAATTPLVNSEWIDWQQSAQQLYQAADSIVMANKAQP